MLNQCWDFASKQTIFNTFDPQKPETLGFTWLTQPCTDPFFVTDNGSASSERFLVLVSDTQPLPEALFHLNHPRAVPGGARQTSAVIKCIF